VRMVRYAPVDHTVVARTAVAVAVVIGIIYWYGVVDVIVQEWICRDARGCAGGGVAAGAGDRGCARFAVRVEVDVHLLHCIDDCNQHEVLLHVPRG